MKNYKDFALDLALKSGKIIKQNFLKGVSKEWKSDETPITATDKEINSLVINSINQHFPKHSILAEEESDLKTSDYVWVCDPIDGTVPFAHGFPTSVFTLALTYQGESILGVIYDPYLDRLVVAEKGKGAFLNNKPIRVSTETSFKNTVIDVEAWSSFDYDLTPLHKLLIDQGCMAATIRSSVYSGMLVAMGQFAAIIHGGKTPWDAAATKIIVEEAGGRATDLFGNDQLYNGKINGFVASNGLIHNQLISLIKAHIKKPKDTPL